MAHYTDYRCGTCGVAFSQDEAKRGKLVRKIVQFATFGKPPRIVKSITTEFLCEEDMRNDADYKRLPNRGPGQRSPGLERVRLINAVAAQESLDKMNGVGQA